MTRAAQLGFNERLRDLLGGNLGLKILSLVAAIVLFALVRGAEDAQRSVYVEVVGIVPALGSGKILVSDLPERVRLTLRGSRSVINSVSDIKPVEVDLSDTNLRYYYFEPDQFEIPAGVTIAQYAPPSIQLTWADHVSHRLPVEPRFVGELAGGLSLNREIRVDPSEIEVSGAQNEIEPLLGVPTQAINISALTEGFYERVVRLEHPPPHAAYSGPESATVAFEVIQERDDRSFRRLRVATVGVVGRVRPPSVDVDVTGPPALVAGLAVDRLVPWIDAPDATFSGTVARPVRVRGVPEGVEVVRIEPAEVLLTVTRGSTSGSL